MSIKIEITGNEKQEIMQQITDIFYLVANDNQQAMAEMLADTDAKKSALPMTGQVTIEEATVPKAQPVQQQPVAQQPTKAYTLEQLSLAGTGLMDQVGIEKVSEVIQSFGANALTEIDEARYPEVAEKLKALGANL